MNAWILVLGVVLSPLAIAGPYSSGLDDPANAHDAPVPGFTGPHGVGKARLDDGFGTIENPSNRVNPLFFAWAGGYLDYERSDSDAGFSDPEVALGPVTGDNFDVVSLGDMNATQIAGGESPGKITLHLERPVLNLSGADFVVFENGFGSRFDTGGSGSGGVWAELAYVEVSGDGEVFHRLPGASLSPSAVGGYGSLDPTDLFNLAGKHVNAYGDSWGTPFDLEGLGLDVITHVRLVDIPGDGSFVDSEGRPIYDGWRTFGSGGFDLEAVGAISTDMTYREWPSLEPLPEDARGVNDDPDKDGIPNLLEYAFALEPWVADAPSEGWASEMVSDSGSLFFELSSLRDERLVDLTREIQISEDMSSWETVAVSKAGKGFQAANGHELSINEERAGGISSVGVIRRDRILDLNPVKASARRFYRLNVSRSLP